LADAPQADPVAGLVDIPLPASVSLWPQTWPSRIAVAALVVGLLFTVWWLALRWYRNRYRRTALAELGQIEHAAGAASPSETSVALASLVRRTALAVFPRERIAPLAGPAWLSFLDSTGNTSDFSKGPGRSLESAVYAPSPETSREMISVVRQWIVRHHA
jgi:Ca-activated chloride channel family protein